MRAVVRRIAHRVGHRGSMLILLGSVALLYGIGLVTLPPAPPPLGWRLLQHMMPMHCWGVTLMVTGAAAIACAPVRQGRDWPGWVALVLVWTPWSLSYLVSWWPQGENPRGWITALLFAALAGMPAVGARWDEPDRPIDRKR